MISEPDGLAQHRHLVSRPVEQAVDIAVLLDRRGRIGGGQIERHPMAQRIKAHGSDA